MHVDLTDLRLFLAVIEAGSITHGAAAVGLSLPAASERLRAMESSGGVRLLDRGRRGVTATEAGEALAHHAARITRQMAQMQSDLGQHAGATRITLRVLANTAAVTEFLPESLAPWMAANPRVDIALQERQSTEIARAITAGFAEIGILTETAARALPPEVRTRPFAIDRLVLVAPPDHPLAGRAGVRFADTLAHPFIALMAGALRDHLEAQAATLGTRLRPRIALRDFADICRMAGAGVGVGVVPERSARRLRRGHGLAIVPILDDWACRPLAICAREDLLGPQALALFDHLAQPPN